jgi:hypothetical protein
MTTSDWLKPAAYGAIGGAVVVAVAGFAWAGWMTSGGATRMGQGMADAGVVAALVPLCMERAAADPGRDAHLTAIRAATGTRQRDALMATGWATPPGSEAPSRDLAIACLAAMDQAGS